MSDQDGRYLTTEDARAMGIPVPDGALGVTVFLEGGLDLPSTLAALDAAWPEWRGR